MPTCKTLNPLLFFKTAEKWYNEDLCCWEAPTQTYNDFLTALTQTYNQECKQDKVFSDYVTQLFTDCLSGSSSSHTHSSCCYWTATTNGDIANSGLTETKIGIGTETPNVPLTVVGDISGTTDLYIDDNIRGLRGQFGNAPVVAGPVRDVDIRGDSSVFLRLESTGNNNQSLEFRSIDTPNFTIYNKHSDGGLIITSEQGGVYTDFITIGANESDTIDLNAHTTISGNTNISGDTVIGGIVEITGKTYLGTVDAAGVSYTNNEILVRQDDDSVEYLTIAELGNMHSATTAYWTANTDGSISNSGLTDTKVGIGTDAPEKIFHVKTAENTVAVFESTDATASVKISDSTDDAYLVGKNNMLYISKSSGSPSSNAEFAFDYVNGKLGVRSTTPNAPLTVVGDISGTTAIYLGKNDQSSNYISGGTAVGGDLSLYSGDDIELYAGDDIVFNATEKVKFTEFGAGSPSLQIDLNDTSGDAVFKDAGNTEIFRIDGSEDSLLMDTTRKIQFRDTGLYIHSTTNGQLDIVADTALVLTSPYVGLGNAATGPGEIRFYEDTTDGTDYAAIKTGALGASYTLTLPVDDGDSGEILSTDGSGVLSWIEAGGGGTSYWTANTSNGITNSGESTSYVGIGISRPTALLQVRDLIKHENIYGSMYYGNYSGTYAAINSSTQGNTAFGKWTLGAFNTYGTLDGANGNTAVGLLSQAYRTTGDYNTSVGQASQQSHTTSSWNTSVGYQAGTGNVYGGVGGNSYNTSIGANAGWYNYGQSGEDTYNTAVGYASLYSSRSFWATSIGALSQGQSLAPHGCTGCTSVGYKSLYNTGYGGYGSEYNIGIGYQAGDNITRGAYNISIGTNADPPSATDDHQMNIGGIIWGNDEYGESKIANVGIGFNDPKTVLDVHHSGDDLTSMANDTGGGEVVYFGANSGEESEICVAGKLMYLHTDGVWYPTDADAVATGGSQLLGICLGASVPDNGMLIRGFFDMYTHIDADPGFVIGAPMYVATDAGYITATAPSESEDFVRVVGYGTATANIIYFNPDQTWVELT